MIYDCDREHVIEFPYNELQKAWNIEKNYMGDCNGYVRFRFAKNLPEPKEILAASMKRKAAAQLAEKPHMIGITAFEKVAKDFPNWKKDLTPQSYRTTLMHLPELWGRVPKIPDRYYGAKSVKKDVPYQGNMDRLALCLETIGAECDNETYRAAAVLFAQSGELYQEITDRIGDYLCDGADTLNEIPALFLQIGDLYQKAFVMFS